ncbi:tRNA (5-methylaminomethyl-2-thiouridylate)-methyltransferase [Sorangium cellulosum]|uniref:tRNA-specific 2-thiouridylase MnmA n=1 Tax=Sorangium cellulosum TaxID=56 RepID=A0A2L0F6F5_SORCE|nr:tRNA 2-thiouridine(34) synthase MnmA [Sorangium cellulosum]AUX47140.1 tRNA (5-methylaminomethyl-2-thiouridylate)-methyltransferase [Sorangium cellulosum]
METPVRETGGEGRPGEPVAPGTRVFIAMSGGVDSSVAAARLCDAGYDVVGVTLHLWDYPDDGSVKSRCCAPEDQHDARRVADHLGIPHYTFDRRALFREHVVDPFVDAYLSGETPSPCVACNRSVKLRELFPLAERLGVSRIATGHYARVVREEGGARLYRGRDRHKDQSYFLHMLRSDELEKLLFPLGDSTKEEVRAEAIARGLPGAEKGESQELCFIPSGSYTSFVAERARDRLRPGPIVDREGRVVGAHGGVHAFTVGQRKGIGVSLGRPAFVVGLDAASGAVRLGDEGDLYATGAEITDAVWSDDAAFPLQAEVRIRARHEAAPGVIERRRDPATGAESFVARFTSPVRAVSPGQMAVAYRGDRVIGGGRIKAALRPEAAS